MGTARTRMAGVVAAGALAAGALAAAPLVQVDASSAAVASAAAPVVATPRTDDPTCTVVGTRRADRLVGTPGPDVICGKGGNDVLIGAGGADVLRGGDGADLLKGGTGDDVEAGGRGRDRLAGGVGDDGLDGGPQADVLQGGPGTNWCTTDPADTADRCVYDVSAPSTDQLSLSTDFVDVTEQDQPVVLRVHVTDDTGADYLMVRPGADASWFPSAEASLVSGTERDGWWEATLNFPRYVLPGTFRPQLQVRDHVGHWAQPSFDEPSVVVHDDTPDLDPPELTVLSPAPDESFDTRTSAAPVTVRVRLVDALSGVHDGAVVHVWAPSASGYPTLGDLADLQLESGDLHDGIWAATVRIPEGSADGRWNLQVEASDAASYGSLAARTTYWGPDLYPLEVGQPYGGRALPIPDGLGVVNVVGRAQDHVAPTVSDVRLSTGRVDTLTGPATVEMSFRATDATGVDGGYVSLVPGTPDEWPRYVAPYLQLVRGTVRDGTWSGTVTLPQGLEPGIYYAEVRAVDTDVNQVMLIASGYPYAGSWEHVLDNNPTVTVVDRSGS